MEQTCEVVAPDEKLKGVVKLRVPGIYGTKGNPLPARMAKLVRPAAVALRKVYADVVAEGGHLYISDMFRSFAEQQKAHEDWKTGKKTAYSPPACNSVHESGRAMDIDAFDTGIGHKRVRQILLAHGWINIVDTLTGAECWHYEFREEKFEAIRKAQGYEAMAREMKKAIGNVAGVGIAEKAKGEVKTLQAGLNEVMAAKLTVDGFYGAATKAAVSAFQKKFGLQVDGVAGPRTFAKLEQLLGP